MHKTITLLLILSLFAGCTGNTQILEPTQQELYSGEKTVQYNYTVDGEHGSLNFSVYKGLSDYLSRLERTYYCLPNCPTNSSIQLRYLDNEKQKSELERFSEAIDEITPSPDARRKIAISLVQNIPYDQEAYSINSSQDRYPYQVLFDARGVCGEKSRLLAYILRHQGYATAILHYSDENHAALGISCPTEYSTKNTGWCFIETTLPSIPTFDEGRYPGFGKIRTKPEVIILSNGTQYYPVQEYLDAKEWTWLEAEITKSGGYLETKDFDKWTILKDKYGIPIEQE